MKRIVIIGGPRTGKTTLALALADWFGVDVMHTDDLIGSLDWSAASEHVATVWMSKPGPWILEGVAAVRAIRKRVALHQGERPCDEVIVLETPRVELTKGQAAMAKGHARIWAEVRGEVEGRGVVVRCL